MNGAARGPDRQRVRRHVLLGGAGAAAAAMAPAALQAALKAGPAPSSCAPWPAWQRFAARFVSPDGRVIDPASARAHTVSEGQAYAQADIQARKAIFRKAALANVPLLRQMEQSLKAKSDRTLPAEFFHDLIDEHFSEEESQRQLETAIQWGRYAEIFDYDAATGKLTLTEA